MRQVRDAIGRKWQCSTIQLDFNLPERFDITYNDEHGEKQRPIVIHRYLFRFKKLFVGVEPFLDRSSDSSES